MPRSACSANPVFGLLVVLGLATGAWIASPPAAQADDAPAPIERDTEVSAQHFEDGEVAAEERRWSDAATSYWKSLESDLENYRAHVGYLRSALQAGDDRAQLATDYDRFVEEHPNRVAMKLHRARLDAPEARLEGLEKLAKSHAQDSNVHLEVGRALLALNQPKPAVAALTKALALKSGKRPDVLLLLAEAEHAAGSTAEAITRLDAAVRTDPLDFPARLVLARLQLAAGDAANSAKHATTVVEQRPSYLAAFLLKAEALSRVGTPEALGEARETLQNAYRASSEDNDVVIALADLTARDETEAMYKLAIKYYDEVLARDAESARAMYGKAWVLERMEKWDEAEQAYREVMSIMPSLAPAVNSVGFCLFKQGRVTEAQVQFKRALDMNKEYVTAMANLGATYDAQAKYGDAIDIYELILKMKGQGENMRALVNCAFDYEATGAFAKALKLLLKAHEVQPADANIVVWIGDNHYFQKKWKDAEKWYLQAIAMDEKSFFAWRGLGLALGQLKKWNDAVSALEKAREVKPDDLELLILLGDLYYSELDDPKTALDRYQEFVQRGGNDPDVNDAILEIKKELEGK
ncbi:MAG: tetratricopeptide repeat protein [Planctomycetota bacterium]|nr:tetratricopeptide repeat protein [Planctomycetota bacterium]